MASIKKVTLKDGSIVYRIMAYSGYTKGGTQKRSSMTWAPPDSYSVKKADKEVIRIAAEFEKKSSSNIEHDDSISFRDFSELWFENHVKTTLKKKTIAEYEKLLPTVYAELGDIRLRDLRGKQITAFYSPYPPEHPTSAFCRLPSGSRQAAARCPKALRR